MIRHVVMVKFKPEVGQEEQLGFTKQVAEALGQIPGVKNLNIGTALKMGDKQTYNAALFIDFDDEAKLQAFLDHPTEGAATAQLANMCREFLAIDCLC